MRLVPPRLRTGETEERHATWLELFLDLVYVSAIANLSDLLHHDDSPAGFARFAGLFVPVWWSWTGHTLFADRFDTDDAWHRFLTVLQMFGAVFLAAALPDAAGPRADRFAIAYIWIRSILVALYARVHRDSPATRPATRLFLIGFGAGVLIWSASLFVPPPFKQGLWGLGILVEFATPWVGRPLLGRLSVHRSHLPERLGLFTLIVLCESISAVVSGVAGHELGPGSALLGALALLSAVGFWQLYFEGYLARVGASRLGSGQLHIYGHLPLSLGLVAYAAGVRRLLLAGPAGPAAWLLGGGAALVLAPLWVMRRRGRP